MIFGDTKYSDLTVGEAINRYAPPTENNTGGYTDFVVGGIDSGEAAAAVVTAAALAGAASSGSGGPGGGRDGSSYTYTPPAVSTPATSGGPGGGHDGSSFTYTPPAVSTPSYPNTPPPGTGGGGSSGGPGGGHDGGSYTYTPPDRDDDPWDNVVKDTGYTTSGGDYVDDGWGENTGGVVKRRPGTNPAAYRQDGGTIPSQQARYNAHPGGPIGTDTVPAWLTEGEFVVDKDSTRRFRPLLEQMNSWEPTSGHEGRMARASDRINQEAMMREKFNRGGAVYRQAGGFTKLLGGAGGDQYAQQREQAMRAKFAAQSGALQRGGLEAQGIAAQNQAGLITQAGLGNQAFTPQAGATAAIGQGIQGAQEAEAQYQGDLANIERQKYEDQVCLLYTSDAADE